MWFESKDSVMSFEKTTPTADPFLNWSKSNGPRNFFELPKTPCQNIKQAQKEKVCVHSPFFHNEISANTEILPSLFQQMTNSACASAEEFKSTCEMLNCWNRKDPEPPEGVGYGHSSRQTSGGTV